MALDSLLVKGANTARAVPGKKDGPVLKGC